MELYPIKFELTKMTDSRLWGGRKLLAFNKPGNSTEPLAEVWEVSDRPEENKESVVANGELAGKTLKQLIDEDAAVILGYNPENGHFPLLVKLIDAAQKLSVQVHPNKEIAKQLNGQSKAEAWVLLDGTDESAYVYAGFSKGVTRETFEAALENGQVEGLLHRINVKSGDVINMPAGRVHAIGEGCLILEVQQSSDTTYRVYDYNRLDPKTGQPRQLHVKEALQSLNFDDQEPAPETPKEISDPKGKRFSLLKTEDFSFERFTGSGTILESTNGVATIVVNIKPQTSFETTANRITVTQNALEFSFIPAGINSFTVSGKDLDYVLIRAAK